MLFKRKKLIGENAIREYMGLRPGTTSITDWRIGYDLPVFKENGVLCAFVADLKKWKKAHPYVKEPPIRPPIPIVITQVEDIRYGFLKIKSRVIEI